MLRYSRLTALLFLILFFTVIIMNGKNLSASDIPRYELTVTLDPEDHSLKGEARVTIPEGVTVHLDPGGLAIQKLQIDGEVLKPDIDLPREINAETGSKILEIAYSGEFLASPGEENSENTGGAGANTIAASGVMLLSGWYPEISGLAVYQLTALIPPDFEAISESDATNTEPGSDGKTVRFSFPHPVPGITLVAGRYHVTEDTALGIPLRTYLFSEDTELADGYIRHIREYLELYEFLLGKFPFESFSVVENTAQTGYSFPTYTLLGSEVIRLPFILKTSLGHEILHQWFGNSVYADSEHGNWSEGLTTYLADHWYEHLKGEGNEYRKKVLIDYRNSVTPDTDLALADFQERKDFSSRTIGYGKGAMVFHMLRKKYGDDMFFQGLRQFIEENTFRNASWDDIKDSFVAQTGQNEAIEQFFGQWIQKKGIPSLRINSASAVFRDGQYTVTLDISQRGDPFVLDVPAQAITSEGEEYFFIPLEKATVHFEQVFSDRPLKIIIDNHYDIMRRLTPAELPPVISAFAGDKANIVVLPGKEQEGYGEISAFFENRGYTVKAEKDVTNTDIQKTSLLLLSTESRIYRRLFADRPLPGEGFTVRVFKNPLNPAKVIAVFHAENRDELSAAYQKIFRYGNYSLLRFEEGRNRARERDDSEKGIVIDFGVNVDAVETESTIGLNEVIQKVMDRRVIFVGEAHTHYAHHLIQFEIIKRIYQEKGKLVIGMEMFQRPFQQYLDQYIQGEIGEQEFLEKTEYFKRWRFDYNLYRDILQFARANQIPVIALNLKKEIIEKVAKEGIDSLTEEEYAEIPQDIDMTNQEYKKSMRAIFSLHARNQQRGFENFFQSQILWDETMAHSAADVLKRYPDTQMVVLAGNGHLQYSWGIPNRVRRLTGEPVTVILNGGAEEINSSLADFVLFPQQVRTPKSPRLMVSLQEGDKGVRVEKLMQGGPAEKAGMEEGDVITMMGDDPIADIADLKVFLLDKKKGDTITAKILRKRFLFGAKEMLLDILLE